MPIPENDYQSEGGGGFVRGGGAQLQIHLRRRSDWSGGRQQRSASLFSYQPHLAVGVQCSCMILYA